MSSDPGRRRFALFAAIAFGAVWLLTRHVFIADAPDYAREIVNERVGESCAFLEFGHLAWRPLGYAVSSLIVPAQSGTNQVALLHTLSVLNALAGFAGLVATVAVALWIRTYVANAYAAAAGVAVFLLSKTFANFAHVGSPYVPALCCLCVGLWATARPPEAGRGSPGRSLAGGVALGLSALFWGPFLFAIPGAVLTPLVLERDTRTAFRRSLLAGVGAAAALLVGYGIIAYVLAFHSFSDFRQWVSVSGSFGNISGIPRVIIGFARAIIDLGQYGTLVKRYLLPDAINPVTTRDLFRVDLLKFAVFYVGLAVILVAAWFHAFGRRAVLFAAVFSAPVLLFAALYQGGDLERYLALLPPLAFITAVAVDSASRRPILRLTLIAWFAVILLANGRILLAWRAPRTWDAALERLPDAAIRDTAKRLVVVAQWGDPLVQFWRNYPAQEVVRGGLTVYGLVTPGTPPAGGWRRQFANLALSVLNQGRPVFVSRRLFVSRPDAEWGWIEGDDPRVSWRDFNAFFSKLQFDSTSESQPQEFVRLSESRDNRTLLEPLAAELKASAPKTCRFQRRWSRAAP